VCIPFQTVVYYLNLFSIHRLYTNLTTNSEWMDDLHAADAILVATHSQGSIVSTHLVERLIREKHIKTSRTSDLLASASAALAPGGTSSAAPSSQRVCCLALCGIHLGPLRYLSSSSLLQPYIQVGVSDSLYDMGFFYRRLSFTSISSRRLPKNCLSSRSVIQQPF
jgi:hypothetical protein